MGSRPAEVWGANNKPSFCKFDKIALIEEEDRLISPLFSIVSEPEGEPVLRYVSTTLLKICFDLSFIYAYKFSDIITNIGIINQLIN